MCPRVISVKSRVILFCGSSGFTHHFRYDCLSLSGSIHVVSFKGASRRFFFHFREVYEKCIEYSIAQGFFFFNFPPIPVGNKTQRKGFKFLTPLGVHPFRWKHCNEKQVRFLRSFEWDCSGVNHSCILPCLT